ncbi:hypothetical protein WICPIJ_007974 [Wickerhamomyces pijperi]|uniref:Peroxisomal membrane protein PMP27 n=1 Tax=Wickerhamomyces pijperi TaxID=599730 RepID=A0A9P8Q0R9_WICPI|nr:hypothetical protein WICPIJ_007974 [Wickerhamomyces pijperi]
MVLDTVVYHPTLLKLIKYLDATAGREKSLRLIQYLVRFLSFQVKQAGYPLALFQLLKNLQNQAAFIRKALRFLKPLNHLQDAAKAFDNKLSDSILRHSIVLKNIAYIGYLSLDSLAWFKILGLVSTKTFSKAPKYANWFWFAGLLAGLVNDLRKITITNSQISSISNVEGNEKSQDKMKAVQVENYKATRKLVWDSLDFFVVLNNLGFLRNSEGAIGLAGTITSVLGVQDVWGATKI